MMSLEHIPYSLIESISLCAETVASSQESGHSLQGTLSVSFFKKIILVWNYFNDEEQNYGGWKSISFGVVFLNSNVKGNVWKCSMC